MPDQSKSVAEVNAAMRKVNSGAEQKQEMQVMMGDMIDYGHFLSPAPMTVGLMGQLILISTNTDFSLADKPPANGWKLINWPDSFRASLLQVVHAGYDSYNGAHTNMDQIRLYTAKVPADFQQVVKLLMTGTKDDIEELLPVPMKSIEDTANHCLRLAEKTRDDFQGVMSLTAELLEALTNAKGSYEQKLKAAETAKAVAEAEKTMVADQKKRNEENKKKLEKTVDKAEETFQSSMDSMPNGWDIVGMEVVGSVMDGVNGALRAYTGQQGQQQNNNAAQPQQGATAPQPQVDAELIMETTQLLTVANQALQIVSEIVQGKNPKEKEGDLSTLASMIAMRKGQIQKLQQSDGKTSAMGIVTKGEQIGTTLEPFKASATKPEGPAMTNLNTTASMMQSEAAALSTRYQKTSSGLGSKTPSVAQAENQAQASGSESMGGKAMRMAQFKVTQAQENLAQSRDLYDKACDRESKNNERMGDLLGQLAKLNIETIEFDKIRAVLVNAIGVMAEMREKWGKLVQFFQWMANLVEVSMNKTMKSFLEYARKGEARRLKGAMTMEGNLKDLLYSTTMESVGIAALINNVSSTYVTVSHKHIMPKIAGLDKLMALDGKKDEAEIKRLQASLLKECKEAQATIESLVKQRQQEFDQYFQKRMATIKNELESILPPVAVEVQQAIQASAQEKVKAIPPPPKAELPMEDFC